MTLLRLRIVQLEAVIKAVLYDKSWPALYLVGNSSRNMLGPTYKGALTSSSCRLQCSKTLFLSTYTTPLIMQLQSTLSLLAVLCLVPAAFGRIVSVSAPATVTAGQPFTATLQVSKDISPILLTHTALILLCISQTQDYIQNWADY